MLSLKIAPKLSLEYIVSNVVRKLVRGPYKKRPYIFFHIFWSTSKSDHGVQTDHGGFISSDHGVQILFGECSKVNTPSTDCRRFSNRPKSKQGIPATTNVPESPVFSVFPNILFIPFVSIKRFTFPRISRHIHIPDCC